MCARDSAIVHDSSDVQCWGHTPSEGTAQGAEGCAEAGGREGRPYGGEGEEIPDTAGRSGTGPYGGGNGPCG